MHQWRELAELSPRITEVGESLLRRDDQGEVALLATVNPVGDAAIAPVCPIFTGTGIYLLISAQTPKHQHLKDHGNYALHAQVGADDLEFQISGVAREIMEDELRQVVIEAIPFPDFDRNDPIFELLIKRALTVTWSAGKPVKSTWRSVTP